MTSRALRGLLLMALAVGSVPACGDSSATDDHPGSATPEATKTPSATDPNAGAPGDAPLVGTFPRGFAFGSAIAGFQVDMGCPTIAAALCEDRASDWYQWITTKRIVDKRPKELRRALDKF